MNTFEGFEPDFVRFFSDLAVEQNRKWFQANKARYGGRENAVSRIHRRG